jgi:hypothetical protein
MTAPAQPEGSFSIQQYVASCSKQVEPGTPEAPGHRVVNLHLMTVDVDLAAAQSQKILFENWALRTRASGNPMTTYLHLSEVVGGEDLSLQTMAVGDALGIWEVRIPADTGWEGAEADREAKDGGVRLRSTPAADWGIEALTFGPQIVRAQSFPREQYLDSCAREVEPGTPETPGHKVVDLHFMSVEVDLAKAQAKGLSFSEWMNHRQRTGISTLTSYVDFGVAVSLERRELGLYAMAVGDALGFWSVYTPADSGLKGAEADRVAIGHGVTIGPRKDVAAIAASYDAARARIQGPSVLSTPTHGAWFKGAGL